MLTLKALALKALALPVAPVHVHRREVVWIVAASALVLVGWRARGLVAEHVAVTERTAEEVRLLHVRLCRLETSEGLSPWPTCAIAAAPAAPTVAHQ